MLSQAVKSDVSVQSHGASQLHEECRSLVEDCFRYITADIEEAPTYSKEWRIGASFSWVVVRETEYRVNTLFTQIERMAMMAAGKKKRGNFDSSAYVFVKCELNSEDKKAAKIWIEANTTDFGPILHDICASDYKFSLSFSSEHDTFTACLVGKEDNAINGKKTLTARHRDWLVAALTVCYKHIVLFKAGVWESGNADDDDGWA